MQVVDGHTVAVHTPDTASKLPPVAQAVVRDTLLSAVGLTESLEGNHAAKHVASGSEDRRLAAPRAVNRNTGVAFPRPLIVVRLPAELLVDGSALR